MILVKILVLQLIVTCVILFVLLEVFRRELILAAFDALEQLESSDSPAEALVVSAVALRAVDERRLKELLGRKFPLAEVNMAVNPGIYGGLVIKTGNRIMDHSLLSRIKLLWSRQDV